MNIRGKLSLLHSPREPASCGGMFWIDSPKFPSPWQHRFIRRHAPSPHAVVRTIAALLGGSWPLLFLQISVLLLSPGSLTPLPMLGLLAAVPGPPKPPGMTSAIVQ